MDFARQRKIRGSFVRIDADPIGPAVFPVVTLLIADFALDFPSSGVKARGYFVFTWLLHERTRVTCSAANCSRHTTPHNNGGKRDVPLVLRATNMGPETLQAMA